MKLTGLVLVSLMILGSTSATAAPKAKKGAASDVVSSSQSASSKGVDRLGVGLTTISTVPSVGLASFSGWFDLTSTSSIQAVFGIASTSPFLFGIGGFFRHTVTGGQQTGVHLGGGLSFGTVGSTVTAASILAGATSATNVFINISPLAGFHFTLPGLTNIMASVDGGPVLSIVDGSTTFGMGGLSSALGFSIHYFF